MQGVVFTGNHRTDVSAVRARDCGYGNYQRDQRLDFKAYTMRALSEARRQRSEGELVLSQFQSRICRSGATVYRYCELDGTPTVRHGLSVHCRGRHRHRDLCVASNGVSSHGGPGILCARGATSCRRVAAGGIPSPSERPSSSAPSGRSSAPFWSR